MIEKEFKLLVNYLANNDGNEQMLAHYRNYLSQQDFSPANQSSFSKYLAQIALTGPWPLKLIDVWTRLFDKKNMIRYKLNALLAMCECDGNSYQQMSKTQNNVILNRIGFMSKLGLYLLTLLLSIFYVAGNSLMWRSKNKTMTYFKGKKVLITGVSAGLGRSLALEAAKQQAFVMGIARRQQQLQELEHEIQALPDTAGCAMFACDISDANAVHETITQIIAEHGSIDIVILNAGVKFDEKNLAPFQKTIDTFNINVFGNIHCIKALLPPMKTQGHGQFALISSLGADHGMPYAQGYNASKAALTILAESLRMDLNKQKENIDVTVVKPGVINTAMVTNSGLAKLLSISKQKAALKILAAIARKKKSLSFPLPMMLMTKVIASLPSSIRSGLLTRLK